MSTASARTRLRELLASDSCTLVAPIFDTISARIAQSGGWEVAKLSSSTLKAVNFGLPDQVSDLVTMMDYAEVIRRIRRVAPDISLAVDIDDAFGSRLSVWRTVQELEAAGISQIEIEDRIYPERLLTKSQGCVLHPIDEQVALFKTALAAREDKNTVIIARTASFSDRQLVGDKLPSLDEALERIRAYAKTGVDGFYIPGEPDHVRKDIEAIHSVTDLPLLVLRMPADVYNDKDFLRSNNVRLRYLGQPVIHMATRAIYSSLKSLKEGGTGTEKSGELDMAYWPAEGRPMLDLLGRFSEFEKVDQMYAGPRAPGEAAPSRLPIS